MTSKTHSEREIIDEFPQVKKCSVTNLVLRVMKSDTEFRGFSPRDIDLSDHLKKQFTAYVDKQANASVFKNPNRGEKCIRCARCFYKKKKNTCVETMRDV